MRSYEFRGRAGFWLGPFVLIGHLFGSVVTAVADEPRLSLRFGDTATELTATELLARPDAAAITIEDDPAYKRDMSYRAVPLPALLERMEIGAFDTIEARATDGFVAQLPARLLQAARSGGSKPWLAIETPDDPWPNVPGRAYSAGPFYLVWVDRERSGIVNEQWPYALAALTGVASPVERWPQLRVSDTLSDDAPARQGQRLFVENCLVCHQINGGGEATIGPDLAIPASPLDYMTLKGLRMLIRDPNSLRSWPDQKMPGFSEDDLSDGDIDDIIAYLGHVAGRDRQ